MTQPDIPRRVPAGATPAADGLLVGHGPVQVDAFIDFMCPFCRRFELASEPAIAALADDGVARFVYHPMNFLDEASTTNYSTRAAAASGCASDLGKFFSYAHELFANQPPEGGPGLSDEELADLGAAAGLDRSAFADCVSKGTYLDWPSYVTARAVALGVNATPTVLVDGVPVSADMQAIAAAVNLAIGAS